MEINLTELWENVKAPFSAVYRKFRGRARSRRQLASQYQSPSPWNATSFTTTVGGTKRRLTKTEQRLRNMKLLRLGAVLLFAGTVVGMIVFFILFAWVSRDLPKAGQVLNRDGSNSKILDRNGKLLYDLYADQRRDPIQIGEVPQAFKEATVAIEDKDFYRHGGFDPLTPFRIIYNYVFRGGRVVGGSTLTQQLVKNAVLKDAERTPIRKFREFILAIQMERKFTKDQILELYFNETPYGGNAVGAGAASEMYYDKPLSQLNLVESAVLAGLPQRPTAYSPLTGKTDTDGTPLWKVRARGVLRRMQEDGYVKKDEYEQAIKDLDTVQFAASTTSIKAPHFVFYVRDLLEKEFGEGVVAKGGLQVTTSLDLDIQDKSQQIVRDEIGKLKNVNITNGAAMVMNPKTGEILAMVGSADYNSASGGGQFNVAVDGLRQPGSSIKPITYLSMFRKGYTPASMLVDAPTTFQREDKEKPYQPNNYDGKFHGPVTLRNSLGSSLNIPAVKSLALVGIPDFLQTAYEMGFPTLEPTTDNMKRFGLSATLGGAEVHLIDTVSAYSAFANGGTKVEPVAILKVQDKDGHVLREFRPLAGKKVISPEEAFLINNVLSDNNARLMAFGANSLLNTNKPIAVKTGTTNDRKDNWTIGWSQEIMVGTWVGNNNSSEMKSVASGITGASPIWRQIIDFALTKGYNAPPFEKPEGIEEIEVDAISGYPSHDGYPTRKDFAIKGTVPALPDPVHSKLKVCKGENKLATDAKVVSGDYDEKEYIVLKENDPFSIDGKNRWQDGITTWINSQTDDKYKPPTDYCGDASETVVKLDQPQNEHKYDSENIDVSIIADSGDGIEKVELWVNGSLKETINSRTYQGKVSLPAGRYELFAKAKSRSGKEVQSGTVRIGTGGKDWQAPASAAPSPSPSPSPSASPIIILPSPTP